MFKNRFVAILMGGAVLLVTLAISQPFDSSPGSADLSHPPRPVIVPVTGAEEARPYVMDSATRSYIAWGEALERAKLNEKNPAPASYRSPRDECFDVPLREIAQCREARQ